MAIKIKSFNHYAIVVADIDKSVAFYHDILGLDILSRPIFDFKGAWLDCGHGIAIHLIEQNEKITPDSGSRRLHFAFAVDDLLATKTYLLSKGIPIIKDIKSRPDGVLQMFIQDPDGYFVELTEV
jgi:catechol 2,3-dioxygenase-like lactoylglutathione lyase family enzyme